MADCKNENLYPEVLNRDGSLNEYFMYEDKNLKSVTQTVSTPKKLKTSEAGFDLTDIDVKKWKHLLVDIDATNMYGNIVTHNSLKWEWKGKGVTIYTSNNPVTGKNAFVKSREPEKGYAGYIGITGDADKVKFVFDYIKEHADNIKDENPTRRAYI